MAYRWRSDLTQADVTRQCDFLNRRNLTKGMVGLGLVGLGTALVSTPLAAAQSNEPNSWEEITGYNNYYEFGTGKGDPAKNAHQLTTSPWSVT
ncbi:MAG: mononuclear molybdenum enzyme YedY, partial [Paracoccaceae bacterium]|nr:mononuclear molybdenum enzyme YedY [Paracoccaceae bacterium]MDP5354864.1 mononuclear molybdenum enzyme YedY [Paracoccaceae bacterium]